VSCVDSQSVVASTCGFSVDLTFITKIVRISVATGVTEEVFLVSVILCNRLNKVENKRNFTTTIYSWDSSLDTKIIARCVSHL